jgi:hypothetical protein
MAAATDYPRGAHSPEWDVLLAGARVRQTPGDRSRLLEAASQPLDWNELLSLAFRHDVAPLLYHALRAIPQVVPAAVSTELHRAAAANAVRNALLFEDLAGILSWAHTNQIDVVVLKGAALADTVYRNRALRPMRDIDLLVRVEHVDAVEEFLVQHGYVLDSQRARAESWYRQHDYHLPYYKRDRGLPTSCVEVHWDLDRPSRGCRLGIDGIWRRAVGAVIGGVPANTLSPEDTVLHLCLHACKHELVAGLRSYCDIAETVRRHASSLDWVGVTERAAQGGVSPFVHLPLALARELLDAPVPDAALERLDSAGSGRDLVRSAADAIDDRPHHVWLLPGIFGLSSGDASARRSPSLVTALSPDVVSARYDLPPGSPRLWWRYPDRVAHLCRSYGPDVWRFLRGGRRAVAQVRRRSQLARFLAPFGR